jgi:hypothetical protein
MIIKGTLLISLSGCYKNHLYVQQEWVDANFLASHHVGTPDPRSENPPEGQRILVAWYFPRCLLEDQLTLLVTVRLWDQTEQIFMRSIDRRRGSLAFDCPNQGDCLDRRVLTYKVEVFTLNGDLIEEWKHHFWTELIKLQPAPAQRSNSSVSSHPKQESVIETP